MTPTILQAPSVKDVYDIGESPTFTVKFRSKDVNTTVTWLQNDSPLEKNAKIDTRYPLDVGISPAVTSLKFSKLTRANAGNYTLIINNNSTLLSRVNRTATTEFTMIFYSKQSIIIIKLCAYVSVCTFIQEPIRLLYFSEAP